MFISKRYIHVTPLLLALLLAAACSDGSIKKPEDWNRTERGAVAGGAGGAALGALAGSQSGNTGAGAVIGGAAGAVAGGVIGNEIDKTDDDDS